MCICLSLTFNHILSKIYFHRSYSCSMESDNKSLTHKSNILIWQNKIPAVQNIKYKVRKSPLPASASHLHSHPKKQRQVLLPALLTASTAVLHTLTLCFSFRNPTWWCGQAAVLLLLSMSLRLITTKLCHIIFNSSGQPPS